MRQSMKIPSMLLLGAIALSGACKKEGSESASRPDPTAPGSMGMLDLVPADSPFVFAAVTPMPEDLDGWATRIGGMLAEIVQEKMPELREEAPPEARAILDEIDGKLSREGLASLGISTRPRFAFYSIGFSLALRVELADGSKLKAAIERIESRAGARIPRHTFNGVEYFGGVKDEAAFAFAIRGNEAIFGVMHEKARDKVLPVLLGIAPPEKSIAAAARAAMERHGLKGITLFYMDLESLARTLTGEMSSLTRDTLALSGIDLPPLSPVCKKEIMELARVAPRMVVDYGDVSQSSLSAVAVMELRQDLARELMEVTRPTLDLSQLGKHSPVMAFGVSMNVGEAIAWARKKASAVAESPYQCEHLAMLNMGLAMFSREALDDPALVMVNGVKGGALVLKELDMVDGEPRSGSGWAVLAMDNAPGLAALVKSQLAGLDLTPGDQPITIPVGQPGIESVDVLVRDSWIGAGVGEGMLEPARAFMAGTPDPRGPFAVMTYDYSSLMKQAMSAQAMDPMEARIVEGLMSMFGRNIVRFRFTERGLVIEQHMKTM